jgi:hypothetical protein
MINRPVREQRSFGAQRRSIAMPSGADDVYYATREQEALAMARAASDPAIQNIHMELAKRYADMVHLNEISALAAPVHQRTAAL